MEETTRTIHGSNILVLGFGRVGKILANMLKGIGANVFCEARKNVDLAWIKAYGYEPVRLNEIENILNNFISYFDLEEYRSETFIDMDVCTRIFFKILSFGISIFFPSFTN